MQFSFGLVLAALAVTAANADERKHLRETKEEEFGETNYDDAAIGGSIKTPDEDFMIDLSDLFGSQTADSQDKINILDLIGSGSNQISLEELVQAFGDDSTSGNGKMTGLSDDDVEDPINVKGGKKGMYDPDTEIEDPINVKGGMYDPDTEIEDPINVKGGMYDPDTEIEDPINVKGGTKGIPVDESSGSADMFLNSDDIKAIDDAKKFMDDFDETDFLDTSVPDNSASGSCGSDADLGTETEDIVNVKGGKMRDTTAGELEAGSNELNSFLKQVGIQPEDITNVKGDNHGVPVTEDIDEDIDESNAMENEMGGDVQVKGSASSPASKMVKTSDVSAPHIDKLYDDGSGVLGKVDEEDEQTPLQSELVSEKKATKISEPFY